MFSTKINIGQLTSLMIQHGIKEVVISPGSRNMPLAETFASCPDFHCHAVTDERSAGFYALGVAQQREEPVAVCVTSGSALLNLASAVSEAYYQQIPLLVISADRPQAWIGQMDGQTLPQTGVFGTLIKHTVHLCEPANETDKWYNNRMINEAMIALTLHHPGPVHINVPITEPFFDCSAPQLPDERMIQLVEGSSPLLFKGWAEAQSPLILVGQLSPKVAEKISPLLEKLGAPVLCESLSNLSGEKFNTLFDLTLLSDEKRQALTPDLVIYLGGHLVSKRLKKWLRAVQPKMVWRISPEGAIADTFQALTYVVKADPYEFLNSLQSHICPRHHIYNDIWHSHEVEIAAHIRFSEELSSLRVAHDLFSQMGEGSSLVLANSSSVRYAQLAKLPKGTSVYCNRGVNGIDGSLSSAVGIAAADPSRPVFLLIGDLSFFYDMNGLWNTILPQNLHILLINNGCGEIFRTLPGLPDTETTRHFVMAAHGTSAQGWVESLPCDYLMAKDFESYRKQLADFTHHQGKAVLFELFTNPEKDEEIHKRFYQQFEL